MMEAVARRKANWLFRSGSEKDFFEKRRPQEDMVTSAVFGSIRLMSSEDRFCAIRKLLGNDAFNTTEFTPDHEIAIELWPRLVGPNDRRHVEPDVLLISADKTVIVEVKWHAPLSERQLAQQIEAVGEEKVKCVVLLGEAGIDDDIFCVPAFRRTWRDVSGDLQRSALDETTSVGRWIATMRAFLQETDMGHVFAGFREIVDPGRVVFRFRKPGQEPWFGHALKDAEATYYKFEGKP